MSNLWRQFHGLLPASTTLICEVISHNTGGVSTVELPNGDRFRAIGQSVAVGDYAYVRDGQVIGTAPDAPGLVELLV